MKSPDLSGKTVFVMRALWEQEPLIRAAKDCGARVIAVDEDEDAEGLTAADESEIVPSLRDLDACLDIAEEYSVDAVVSDECDYSAFVTAYIGARLNLPAISISTAQITTNKRRLRHLLEDYVSQPNFEICATPEGAKEATESTGYPLITKPVDNRGAFGVSRVTDSDDLRESFFSALANSHAREVILEEFIEGTPITVEGYYLNGDHRTLAIGEKDSSLGNLDPQREITYPADLSTEVKKRVHEVNDSIASKVDGSMGATHAEYIITEEGDCYPIEFHNRGGGIHISAKVVPELTGFDVSRQLLADAFGKDSGQEQGVFEIDGTVIIHPLRLPQGTIIELEGQDEVQNNPDILTFKKYFDIGDDLEEPDSPVLSHGLIIARGATRKDARQTVEEVYETLVPTYK
jgi:biotin carboxylase